ncbi:MAG: hypothetical protein MJZ21_03425, partial [archaeon]|nr:hypothetical protein [archaeon]
MNTREEIIDALSGKDIHSSPPAVFTQTGTIGQMDHCDSSWPEAIFKANKMAELSLQLHRQFGFATAKVPFCITVEAEALGCVLGDSSRDRQPAVVSSPYRDQDGIPDVPDLPSPAEYSETGRLPVVREAAGIVMKNEDVFTIGGCVDPATATMQLLGADDYLVGTLIEPESCRKWIRALTPLMTEELKQLSETVDDVQIIAMADSNLTTNSEFDTMVGEPVGHMISVAESLTTIHSCGDTKPILGKLSSLGENGLSVETSDDPEGIF